VKYSLFFFSSSWVLKIRRKKYGYIKKETGSNKRAFGYKQSQKLVLKKSFALC